MTSRQPTISRFYTNNSDFITEENDVLIFDTQVSNITEEEIIQSLDNFLVEFLQFLESADHASFDCFDYVRDIKITCRFPKQIDEFSRNSECPITYNTIEYGNFYVSCVQCRYNFSEVGMVRHLIRNNSCPMCRSEWKHKYGFVNCNETMWKWIKFLEVCKQIIFTSTVSRSMKLKRRYHKRWYNMYNYTMYRDYNM
jgi:hypothetical protein